MDALVAPPVALLFVPLQSVELLDLEFSGACFEFKVVCEGEKGKFVTPADCCKAVVISAAAIVGFKEPSSCADARRVCWWWCCCCGCGGTTATAGGDVESTEP